MSKILSNFAAQNLFDMILDNSRIVSCPFCGAKKELLSLTSGNTIGATQWSDGKLVAPMLPSVSPVQKCPHCGKYYLHYKQDGERGENGSGETGNLSYKEWKEAYLQFTEGASDGKSETNGFLAKITQKFSGRKNDNAIDNRDLCVIYRGIINSYNDCFYRGQDFLYSGGHVPSIDYESAPPQEEYDFFVGIIEKFISVADWSSTDSKLMKAELYREAGQFENCINTLNSIDIKPSPMSAFEEEKFEHQLHRNIKKRAEAKVAKVFRIGEVFLSEEEKRVAKERQEADAREAARFQKQAKDPRWKVCKHGHCFKNTERVCRWCGEAEFVERLDEQTPIFTKQLFVGKRNGKWILTTDQNIEGQTERIRSITIDYNGKYRFYYHMDGKNPHPFYSNNIRLDDETSIEGKRITRACDVIMLGKTSEVTIL